MTSVDLHLQRTGPAPLDSRAEQVVVPMRDGVRLATDVYLPPGPTTHPAVLVRLPYDKCGRYTFMPYLAPHFTDRGYAFVVQDVRGKFRSEGETMPYVHEVADGYDTLEWIVSQPWSNGDVGMFGDSYYGFTQWAAVASGHPALRAIVPRVTSADVASARLGLRWDEAIPILYAADYLARNWTDNDIYEFDVDWGYRPLAEVFDEAFRAIGARSAGFDRLLENSRTLASFSPYPSRHPFETLRIPVLQVGGWFDNLAPDQMRDYMSLKSRQATANLQYLVMDASDHENYFLDEMPISPERDHDVNDNALAKLIPIYLGPALEFYDVFLAGKVPTSSLPRVRWNLGHVGWRTASTWPPPEGRELMLYLGAAQRSVLDAEGGRLTSTPEKHREAGRWIHDPASPVSSTVDNPWAFLREYPDEREVEGRSDVATFTSEPFEAPLDIAGPVCVRLAVGSSAPSMHVFARLLDVAPDGSAHTIVRGQAMTRHPDTDHLIEVGLGHTGYRLKTGHRLRLHVAASDFPLYVPYPGIDENPWFAAPGRSSEQTVVTGGRVPSHVRVSVV